MNHSSAQHSNPNIKNFILKSLKGFLMSILDESEMKTLVKQRYGETETKCYEENLSKTEIIETTIFHTSEISF